ncbi:MAG: nucleotidyltransferase domain-containing protein [bacterium]|nr:nucleotidyltransferase domain-containing protein [bacterium]
MEKPAYEEYAGKPKDARREAISSSGALDRKRFLLSASPEWKERIRKLQDIVYELKKEHPEAISLSLFGSLTKGYANEKSDVDAYLNVDNSSVNIPAGKRVSNAFFLAGLIGDKLREEFNLSEEQVGHIIPALWSKKTLKEDLKDSTYNVNVVRKLFLLSVGANINEYRKIVFDELEAKGIDGDLVWISIMDELANFENSGLPGNAQQKRRLLYPKTLAEGRKYFLQESKEGIS